MPVTSELSDNFKYKYRGFETLRDLTVRRLIGHWSSALMIGCWMVRLVIKKRVLCSQNNNGQLTSMLIQQFVWACPAHSHRDIFLCPYTVYSKKYAHGFVVLCFVVVMQSFIMNPHEVFIHIHQGCFAGTVAIVRLPQCQWSKPDGHRKNQSMYNHKKAQQSKNRVHISWDILYITLQHMRFNPWQWRFPKIISLVSVSWA